MGLYKPDISTENLSLLIANAVCEERYFDKDNLALKMKKNLKN